MRIKRMKISEFQPILERDWTRLDMTSVAPEWMWAVPAVLCLASGSNIQPVTTSVEGRLFSDAVGGMDVFRHDPQDAHAGGTYNKDHYVIVRDADENYLLVFGPFKDAEHWVDTIPAKYQGVEILLPPTSSESLTKKRL